MNHLIQFKTKITVHFPITSTLGSSKPEDIDQEEMSTPQIRKLKPSLTK